MDIGLLVRRAANVAVCTALLVSPSLGAGDTAYADFDSAVAAFKFDAPEYFEVLPNGLTVIVDENSSAKQLCIVLLGRPEALRAIPNTSQVQDALTWSIMARLHSACADVLTDSTLTAEAPPDLTPDLLDLNWGIMSWCADPPAGQRVLNVLPELLGRPEIDVPGLRAMEEARRAAIRRQELTAFAELLAKRFEEVVAQSPHVKTATALTESDIARLPEYSRRFFAPNNLILAISGPARSADVSKWIAESLGRMERTPLDSAPSSAPAPMVGADDSAFAHTVDGNAGYLLAVGTLPRIPAGNTIDIQLAAAILEGRLRSSLEERRQLASDVRFRAYFDRDNGWCVLHCRVLHENSTLLDALTLECEKLAFDGPTGVSLRGPAVASGVNG
jgi:hypothetical protein